MVPVAPKKPHSRREECGLFGKSLCFTPSGLSRKNAPGIFMVVPNERAFLGTTQRTGLFFPLAVLPIAYVEQLHHAHGALRVKKIDTSRHHKISVNRP